MTITSPAHTTHRPAAALTLHSWRSRTALALVALGALYLFLELVITTFATKEPKEPAVFVLASLDLVVAALLLRLRQGWLSLVAVVVFLVQMVGAAPHDLSALIHPDDAGQFVFSVLIFGVPVAGIVSALQDFRLNRSVTGAG